MRRAMAKSVTKPTPRSRQIPEADRRALGSRLFQRRRDLGWTQRQLAERALIAFRRISRFENGRTAPNLPETIRLAGALDLSLDRLVLGQPPPSAPPKGAPSLIEPIAEIERLGTAEEFATLSELLRTLLVGYRVTREARK